MADNDFIYDLETYPNVFTCATHEVRTGKRRKFEISERRNDMGPFLHFLKLLKAYGCRMVGFNNIGFDYPVIHHMVTRLQGETDAIDLTEEIYRKAQSIIDTPFHSRFTQRVAVWKHMVPQLDLMMIHHFDNVAKATSLKMLEFNMRMDDIRELPFPVGTWLTRQHISELIDYNGHDIDATLKFYNESKSMIEFREALSAKYDRDFLNHNDTKIGKDYFIMRLEQEVGPDVCYTKVDGKRHMKQTERESIALADVILPMVKFETPQFNAVLDWIRKQVITETKAVFTGIPEEDLGDLARYADLKKVKGAVKNLNVVLDGVQFVFGTGGLHASISAERVESDEDMVLMDCDVTSYYPSLAIVNGLYPEHLTEEFCRVYTDMKEQRMKYTKGTPENAMLKLALNGVYGDSNNPHSPFLDPQYTMSITVNGQLLLCMLYEQLRKIPGARLIQVNTDGITVKIPRDQMDRYRKVCQAWEKLTKLDLEFATYEFMHIRDVNNYHCLTTDGKAKRKGAYEYEINWHQNHSALVVQKAAERNIIYGTDIGDWIREHDDMHDFMLRTKVPRTSHLLGADEAFDHEWPMQHITRYYVSTDGVELVKVMPPLPKKPDHWRRIAINKGFKVTPVNRWGIIDPTTINYEWYIKQATALVRFKDAK